MLDGNDAKNLLQLDTTDVEANQVKVKFVGSDKYMGRVMTVSFTTTTGITSSVDIAITYVLLIKIRKLMI
jgi:hypothetical protein